MTSRTLTAAAYFTAGVGLLLIVGFAVLYALRTTGIDLGAPLDVDVLESYGALVGGLVAPIFALAGLWLVIATLNDQKDVFRRQQIETRFFQLVSIARENSKAASIGEKSGRKVFITLARELTESYYVAYRVCKRCAIGKEHIPNIAYLAFFYGAVGVRSARVLRRILAGRFPKDFTDALFREYATQALLSKESFSYKPFQGHQSRLGHYYRHLFQTVTYINNQGGNLTYGEKYEYVKTLRAQLSTHEQLIFFWNSLSDVGRRWELDRPVEDVNHRLITKYNLIKNIPDGFSPFDPRKYYPWVQYEGLANPPAGRATLQGQYQ
jgi:hypothetical protein